MQAIAAIHSQLQTVTEKLETAQKENAVQKSYIRERHEENELKHTEIENIKQLLIAKNVELKVTQVNFTDTQRKLLASELKSDGLNCRVNILPLTFKKQNDKFIQNSNEVLNKVSSMRDIAIKENLWREKIAKNIVMIQSATLRLHQYTEQYNINIAEEVKQLNEQLAEEESFLEMMQGCLSGINRKNEEIARDQMFHLQHYPSNLVESQLNQTNSRQMLNSDNNFVQQNGAQNDPNEVKMNSMSFQHSQRTPPALNSNDHSMIFGTSINKNTNNSGHNGVPTHGLMTHTLSRVITEEVLGLPEGQFTSSETVISAVLDERQRPWYQQIKRRRVTSESTLGREQHHRNQFDASDFSDIQRRSEAVNQVEDYVEVEDSSYGSGEKRRQFTSALDLLLRQTEIEK